MRRTTVFSATTLVAGLLALTACSATGEGPATESPAPASPAPKSSEFAVPAFLEERGTVIYCATLDNPPRASVDESGNQVGFEVELGEEIARLGGLEVVWLQLTFDGLISAVQADQCDVIMQELFIKAERLEIMDMIPFSNSGHQIVVLADGEFADAQTLADLSGAKAAVPNGTTQHILTQEASDALEAEGKAPIGVVVLQTTTDSFQQLSSGVVDAVVTTTTAAAYYKGIRDDFTVAGPAFDLIQAGIAVKKGNDELTAFIQEAFDHIYESGLYDELIVKWNMQGSAL